MTYSSLSKRFPKHSYFCGWYYRCQSNKQTLAIIPSVHKTKDSAFCTIQMITDTHAFHVQFPYDDLGEDDDQIRISNKVKIKDGEIVVRQGRFCLTVKRLGLPGHPLQAPVGGAMTRTIHEHPACKVYYRFSDVDVTLLELEAPNAAF